MKLALLMVCKILSWDCYGGKVLWCEHIGISATEVCSYPFDQVEPQLGLIRAIWEHLIQRCILPLSLSHSHLPHTNRKNRNCMQLHTLQLASNSFFEITSAKALKMFLYKRELAGIILQRTNSLEYGFFYVGIKSHENYPIVKDIVWHVWFTQFHAEHWD